MVFIPESPHKDGGTVFVIELNPLNIFSFQLKSSVISPHPEPYFSLPSWANGIFFGFANISIATVIPIENSSLPIKILISSSFLAILWAFSG